MRRLLVHVEGPTEETFVNNVLDPHLGCRGYSSVAARLMGNARPKSHRGGGLSWQSVREGILRHLKQDWQVVATTMVDYYGMPKSRSKRWPGRIEADSLPFVRKAETIQDALARDICEGMGRSFNPCRFIPYVSMHEFEALLFSDCMGFADSVGHPGIGRKMQEILDQFGSPEAIDDSYTTAPSKRIEGLLPSYDKVAMCPTAIRKIGLENIRCRCPHFAGWLSRLEAVVTND